MPEIKTCDEYVLAQLLERDNEVTELKSQLKVKDTVIEELKERNEKAIKLLRLLDLNLHDPNYVTDWDGMIIDCEFILPSDREKYNKAMELVKALFDLEEITRK